MTRSRIRAALWLGLIFSAVFAAWSWLRPYAWKPDPAARGKIVGAMVKRDLSYHWLDLHLQVADGKTHDLTKPIRLETAAGRALEPADTTLEGTPSTGYTAIWLKFWLEPGDFSGPLKLRINDGTLVIRTGSGVPNLAGATERFFPTCNW